MKEKWYIAQTNTKEYNELTSTREAQFLKLKHIEELAWRHTLN